MLHGRSHPLEHLYDYAHSPQDRGRPVFHRPTCENILMAVTIQTVLPQMLTDDVSAGGPCGCRCAGDNQRTPRCTGHTARRCAPRLPPSVPRGQPQRPWPRPASQRHTMSTPSRRTIRNVCALTRVCPAMRRKDVDRPASARATRSAHGRPSSRLLHRQDWAILPTPGAWGERSVWCLYSARKTRIRGCLLSLRTLGRVLCCATPGELPISWRVRV